jgi:hypothetical protein
MCGRFLNKLPVAEIARIFGTRNVVRGIQSHWNQEDFGHGRPQRHTSHSHGGVVDDSSCLRADRQGSSRSRSRCHHLRIACTGAESSLGLELARAFHERVMGFEILADHSLWRSFSFIFCFESGRIAAGCGPSPCDLSDNALFGLARYGRYQTELSGDARGI